MDEANATRLHHAEKEPLLVDAIFAPDQRIEQRACKTTVGIAKLAIALLALKDGINRLQRPLLIEDDAVVEQPLLVEHDPYMMKIIEQQSRIAHTAGFGAELLEELLR